MVEPNDAHLSKSGMVVPAMFLMEDHRRDADATSNIRLKVALFMAGPIVLVGSKAQITQASAPVEAVRQNPD